MATIAVGDVHGNLAALNDILDQIRGESARGDTIVFLGDYIDRGPDAKGCVDAILGFQRDVRAEVVCLLGNHEDWFLRTLRDYGRHSWLLGMEAFDTIGSYSVDAVRTLRDAVSDAGAQLYLGHCALPYEAFFDCVPPDHIRFFEGLRPYHRTADCVCTHGGLDPRITRVQEQSREALIWGAGSFPHGYEGAEVVVYGHRNNATLSADGWPAPTIVGSTIGVDTISHGVLTGIRLPDRRVFQSARHNVLDSDV
jgi:diadenosine tetraphosphatase ApaH/serine/threonine PP2A family protein phosphatase